jgi:uncharacterized membrane protein
MKSDEGAPEAPAHRDRRADVATQGLAIGTRFEGPIPPPEMLREYERIKPGFADRILGLAEREAAHRHQETSKLVDAQITDASAGRIEARWGQILAFFVGLFAIGAGSYVAVHDAQWAGGFIGTGGVVGLVSVFIQGRRISPPNLGAPLGPESAQT